MKKTASIRPNLSWQAVLGSLLLLAGAMLAGSGARAQSLDPVYLEELIAPIALYPDDVLGIVLPASTFPLEIVQAARFLDELEVDPSLEPDPEWDDSIIALLNYPEIVRMLDEDIDWTWELGEAVLTDEQAVLAAAQNFRSQALNAGNLVSDDRQIVSQSEGVIEIAPADPEIVYIPIYEPREVIVYQPRPIYRYYPIGYPVYYYPYPAGHFFGDLFWGVTSYFSIGWHTHHLHVHHHSHRLHPYYLHSYYYYTPYYRRSNVILTVSGSGYTNVWAPSPRRRGSGPRTVTAEGRVSTARTRATATTETQPNVRTRAASLSGTSSSRTRATTQRSVPSTSTSPSQIRGVRSSDVSGSTSTGTRTTAPTQRNSGTRSVPPTAGSSSTTRSGNGSSRTVPPSTSTRSTTSTTRATTTRPSSNLGAVTRTPTTSRPAPATTTRSAPATRPAPATTTRSAPAPSSAPATTRSAPATRPAPQARSAPSGAVRSSGGSTRSSGGSTRRQR